MKKISIHAVKPCTRILLFFLFLILLFALVGCTNQHPSLVDGKYINPDGSVIEDKDVTLDVIAQCEYGKDFNDLRKGDKRQSVIEDYLAYHLPDATDSEKQCKEILLEQISKFEIPDANLPTEFENDMSKVDGFLSQSATALSLADIYAEFKGDDGFGEFVEKLSDTCEIADVALEFSNACFLIADLANNDISNKQEYCEDLIDALSFITGHVPVFGDYFTESLSVVKEGVKIVIENDTNHQNLIEIYGEEIKAGSFFSINLGNDRVIFERIIDPSKWDDSCAPSIADVLRHSGKFDTIPTKEGYVYLREYILFRISYEMKHHEEQGTETPTEPNKPSCAHVYQGKVTKKATCENEGVKTFTCNHKCGASYTEPIPATGHDYEDTVVAPTYDAQGYTLHTCKNCGNSYQDSYVDQLVLSLPDLSQSKAWCGYSVSPPSYPVRFDITIDQMAEDHISGSLEVSVLYEIRHKTSFTGTGTTADGIIEYTLLFETPAVLGTIPTFEYDTITMYYDSATDSFSFDGCYDVDMYRVPLEAPPTLAENVTWSGLGEDPYYNTSHKDDHQFVLTISKMNEMEISGYFTLSYNGNIDHESEFIGRGYKNGNTIYYEIKLLTPRTEKVIITITVESFGLEYNCETDVFDIDGFYSAVLERQQG